MKYFSGTCGGNFSDAYGIFTSPLYPQQYPANSDCTYIISQPHNDIVNLNILLLNFHLDCDEREGVHDCYDYLEIRDGITPESPLIGKFCGDDTPSVIQSVQSSMRIR